MTAPIKKETVVQDIIGAVESGQLVLSNHALLRMRERNIDFSDIEEAIYRCIREEERDTLTDDGLAWKYVIRGSNDFYDKDIRLVVLYLEEPKMLVVTAIDKNC